MASDDNERGPLPESVERALAEARAKSQASQASQAKGPRAPIEGSPHGRWLALVPFTMALIMFLLVMPREVAPEDIPLPQISGRELAATKAADTRRAERARSTRLPTDVLAVGTAMRALGKLQATGETDAEVGYARATLEDAVRFVRSREDQATMLEDLRTLRALQLDEFLTEVRRYEASGISSNDLRELGGGFVDRMRAAGWTEGNRFVLDEGQRRAAFKFVWNATTGTEKIPELGLTLDEQRALYILYLTHPHAPEVQRPAFASQRRAATDPQACVRVNVAEAQSTELWRAEKIRRLGDLDASYPTNYALGVAYYRAGRLDLATESFRRWVEKNPDGAWTLRAKNHLRATVAGHGAM